MELHNYAMAHEGKFPVGGPSPEASLSLLLDGDWTSLEMLRGKTVSLEVVQKAIEENGHLGPASCGWHYVEGLTIADDPQLAVVWDKVGLGHNGRRLPGGGHEVCFVGGWSDIVFGKKWPEFLKQQKALMQARDEAATKGIPRLSAKVRLPTGEIVDHCKASYLLHRQTNHSSGSSSGPELLPSALKWYRLVPENGTMTLSLTLDGRTSKPVTVRIANGKATPERIVFEMAPAEDEP